MYTVFDFSTKYVMTRVFFVWAFVINYIYNYTIIFICTIEETKIQKNSG